MPDLPRGEEKARTVRSMFDRIAPRYDLVNRVMTLRMDVGWRRETVRALGLPSRSLVLDVACGTGDLCCELSRSALNAVGLDMSWGMLAAAPPCGSLIQGDALALPIDDGVCDGVTCGFALRNVTDLVILFAEIGRVTRSGGRLAILEVAEPSHALARTLHHAYFHRVVPLIGGILSDKEAYRYLPRSTEYLPPVTTLLDLVRAAGFQNVVRTTVGFGAAQIITGTRSR
jgi:demethylmenaquinone methyltransferase/2-methoxy-6-polyprenyl-1,4-benzoquinol methylase